MEHIEKSTLGMDIFTVDDLSALISVMKKSGKQSITMTDIASHLAYFKLERTAGMRTSDNLESNSISDHTFQQPIRDTLLGTYTDMSNTTPRDETQSRSRSRTSTGSGRENHINPLDSDSKRIRKDDLNYGPFRNDDTRDYDSSCRNSNDLNDIASAEGDGLFTSINPPATSIYLSGLQNYTGQQINTANMRRSFKLKKSPTRPSNYKSGPFSSSEVANGSNALGLANTHMEGVANDMRNSSVFSKINNESQSRIPCDNYNPHNNVSNDINDNGININNRINTMDARTINCEDFDKNASPHSHFPEIATNLIEKTKNTSPTKNKTPMHVDMRTKMEKMENVTFLGEEYAELVQPSKVGINIPDDERTIQKDVTNIISEEEQEQEQDRGPVPQRFPELNIAKVQGLEKMYFSLSFDKIPTFGSRSAPVDLSAEKEEETGVIFLDGDVSTRIDDVVTNISLNGNKKIQDNSNDRNDSADNPQRNKSNKEFSGESELKDRKNEILSVKNKNDDDSKFFIFLNADVENGFKNNVDNGKRHENEKTRDELKKNINQPTQSKYLEASKYLLDGSTYSSNNQDLSFVSSMGELESDDDDDGNNNDNYNDNNDVKTRENSNEIYSDSDSDLTSIYSIQSKGDAGDDVLLSETPEGKEIGEQEGKDIEKKGGKTKEKRLSHLENKTESEKRNIECSKDNSKDVPDTYGYLKSNEYSVEESDYDTANEEEKNVKEESKVESMTRRINKDCDRRGGQSKERSDSNDIDRNNHNTKNENENEDEEEDEKEEEDEEEEEEGKDERMAISEDETEMETFNSDLKSKKKKENKERSELKISSDLCDNNNGINNNTENSKLEKVIDNDKRKDVQYNNNNNNNNNDNINQSATYDNRKNVAREETKSPKKYQSFSPLKKQIIDLTDQDESDNENENNTINNGLYGNKHDDDDNNDDEALKEKFVNYYNENKNENGNENVNENDENVLDPFGESSFERTIAENEKLLQDDTDSDSDSNTDSKYNDDSDGDSDDFDIYTDTDPDPLTDGKYHNVNQFDKSIESSSEGTNVHPHFPSLIPTFLSSSADAYLPVSSLPFSLPLASTSPHRTYGEDVDSNTKSNDNNCSYSPTVHARNAPFSLFSSLNTMMSSDSTSKYER